jgi:Predicted acyltransferases
MRYYSLDGLRGLAALSVVLHHWLYCFTSFWKTPFQLFGAGYFGSAALLLPPLYPFVNGGGAVLIFFVLSGFVLTLGLDRPQAPSYGAYILNRFVRIYPAFAGGILLAALGVALVGYAPIVGLSDWFNRNWSEPLSAALIAGHLAMLGGDDWITLNNVMWSLVIELRIAIIMPIICIAMKRAPLRALVASALLSLAGHIAARMLDGPLVSWFDTLRYVVLFAAGAGIAIYREWVVEKFRNLQKWQLVAMFVIAMALYGYPFSRGVRLYATAPAAIIITIAAFASPYFRGILERAPFQYLGRVSYSLYLVHLPVILAVMHLSYGKVATPILFAASIAASFALAELLYRAVERPSHKIARAITGNATGKTPVASIA